jgi:hypothetical protein
VFHVVLFYSRIFTFYVRKECLTSDVFQFSICISERYHKIEKRIKQIFEEVEFDRNSAQTVLKSRFTSAQSLDFSDNSNLLYISRKKIRNGY